LDETTDVSDDAQLIAHVCYPGLVDIKGKIVLLATDYHNRDRHF
jgi:hypothetical protein